MRLRLLLSSGFNLPSLHHAAIAPSIRRRGHLGRLSMSTESEVDAAAEVREEERDATVAEVIIHTSR
jgi:hypothetical protein